MTDPERTLSGEEQDFVAFISHIPDSDLAQLYSSFRFLAEFKTPLDVWKRDACRLELHRRDQEVVNEAETRVAGHGELASEAGA